MKNKTSGVKLAMYFSTALIALGGLYIILIAWGLITADPATGMIQNDKKILMEITTILSSILLLLFFTSIHFFIEPRNIFFSFLSIIFMSFSTVLTCCVHFISISVADKILMANELLTPILSMGWPSVLLSIDILSWDFFFGLAILFLGIGLFENENQRKTAVLMLLSGIFSLFGLIALPLDNMNIRYIGVFGYTLLPVIVCIYFNFAMKKNSMIIPIDS
ncbi:MAG: hypothetical protein CVU46_00700 [Chloroflexi bacterium HGW-Chloroflexi-8]|nr:MAG: hypothetical protein CVU46_00700 [Chloroflexi bacterium HGW-Chloroflexi-8]